jgi:hypothetical protein
VIIYFLCAVKKQSEFEPTMIWHIGSYVTPFPSIQRSSEHLTLSYIDSSFPWGNLWTTKDVFPITENVLACANNWYLHAMVTTHGPTVS